MTAAACHPGEVLAQKLKALGVTPTGLARQLHVPANWFTQIENGKNAVTGDLPTRLARWFGYDPEQWMALQARYVLTVVMREAGNEIANLPTCPHISASTAKRQTKPEQGRAV